MLTVHYLDSSSCATGTTPVILSEDNCSSEQSIPGQGFGFQPEAFQRRHRRG